MLTDFHSHILPGIDDGSEDIAMSLKMLEQSADQGVKQIVATPHFYAWSHRPEEFLARRATALEALSNATADHPDLPGILCGAEVHYFPRMGESEALCGLTLAGTNYLLVEMPTSAWSESMFRDLENLHLHLGLTPIIAHVERCFQPLQVGKLLSRLERMPVLVQSNASFFTDRRTSAKALRLLKKGQIHLLGSDCHNLTSRQPNLGPAKALIEQQLGESALAWIRRHEQLVLTDSVQP